MIAKGEIKRRKIQSSLLAFATSGNKQLVPMKVRQENQQLKTSKFIVDCMLPFSIVEEASFCEMIMSHNPHAKVMSNKKIKSIIIKLDNSMRQAAIDVMKGK